MKNIVVLYSGDDWDEMTLSQTTKTSFENFHRIGLENGIAFFRSSIDWYDKERGVFKKAWAFRKEEWIRVDEDIKPAGVLDKTIGEKNSLFMETKLAMLSNFPVVNHPFFSLLLDNKFYQALLFEELMPKTVLAHNLEELTHQIQKLKGSRIVLKPLSGSGGNGVLILSRESLPEDLLFPLIAQEFLEAYPGIPGFSKETSVADLRLVYIGGKLLYALSRVAKGDSLLTNFHKGAAVVRVPLEAIPQAALTLAEKVSARLALFPRGTFSVDIMYNLEEIPFLIEINTKPGFDLLYLMDDIKLTERYFEQLQQLFN